MHLLELFTKVRKTIDETYESACVVLIRKEAEGNVVGFNLICAN